MLLIIVLLGLLPSVAGDCDACAALGDCAAAYNGSHGYVCGFVQQSSCCCPLGSQCLITPFFCRCLHLPSFVSPSPPVLQPSESSSDSTREVVAIAIGVAIIWCFVQRWRRRRRRERYLHLSQVPQYTYTHRQTAYLQPMYYPQVAQNANQYVSYSTIPTAIPIADQQTQYRNR
ncbi:hypothetical protein THRCLA_21794 [Thraustotheca clavata]|uniref:Secreted protein n=1 Tax=Thraustotheca clavata TaxID=74557 RepID=A0A1V9ZP50_9STRA|nr:hypothetical protein THRCLA_21794 [Thraustotheca clavata]